MIEFDYPNKPNLSSAPCCTFSSDTTLMAAGFSESYIRLWSLKNEKLKGLRNDFSMSSIKDCECLYSIE